MMIEFLTFLYLAGGVATCVDLLLEHEDDGIFLFGSIVVLIFWPPFALYRITERLR